MSTAFRTAVAAGTLATASLLGVAAQAHAEPGPAGEHERVGVMQDDRIDIANTLARTGKLLGAKP
ncbi:hypothetical protein [Streptomyces sp. SYSU K217416]